MMTDSIRKYSHITPPPLKLQLRELLSGMYLQDLMQWKSIPLPQTVKPKTVLLIPGFGCGDFAVLPLKKFLRSHHHNSYSWGLGINHSRMERLLDPLMNRIKDLCDKHGEPVALVGWSLGGIFARELVRDQPEYISSILTMGSPVIVGPRATALKNLSKLLGWNQEQIERDMLKRFDKPIERPITAIYSKLDGIVSWQACIDHWSPKVEHYEVSASHIGMSISKEVYQVISHSMAH
jgi:pimeloyl-ACP methyl ester carboxylesterase